MTDNNIIRLDNEDVEMRDEIIFALRYMYGISWVGINLIEKDDYYLALGATLIRDKYVHPASIMYAAEMLDFDITPDPDDKERHMIKIGFVDDGKFRNLIEQTYNDYTLKGRSESDLWD